MPSALHDSCKASDGPLCRSVRSFGSRFSASECGTAVYQDCHRTAWTCELTSAGIILEVTVQLVVHGVLDRQCFRDYPSSPRAGVSKATAGKILKFRAQAASLTEPSAMEDVDVEAQPPCLSPKSPQKAVSYRVLNM